MHGLENTPFLFDTYLSAFLLNNLGVGVQPYTPNQKTALPVICYTQTYVERTHKTTGSLGLVKSKYQFNIFAASQMQVNTIAESVYSVLDGFRGTMTSLAGTTVQVNSALSIEEAMDWSPPVDSNMGGRWNRICRYSIWYTEPLSANTT